MSSPCWRRRFNEHVSRCRSNKLTYMEEHPAVPAAWRKQFVTQVGRLEGRPVSADELELELDWALTPTAAMRTRETSLVLTNIMSRSRNASVELWGGKGSWRGRERGRRVDSRRTYIPFPHLSRRRQTFRGDFRLTAGKVKVPSRTSRRRIARGA